MRTILLFGLIAAFSFSFAQSDSANAIVPPPDIKVITPKDPCFSIQGKDTVYELKCVSPEPIYDGGTTSMYQYIGKVLKYPNEARALGIQGRVYISFFIEADGSVQNAGLLKGIIATAKDSTLQPKYDAAVKEMHERAITVIREMPKWKPGYLDGVAVRTRYVVPIMYRIQ